MTNEGEFPCCELYFLTGSSTLSLNGVISMNSLRFLNLADQRCISVLFRRELRTVNWRYITHVPNFSWFWVERFIRKESINTWCAHIQMTSLQPPAKVRRINNNITNNCAYKFEIKQKIDNEVSLFLRILYILAKFIGFSLESSGRLPPRNFPVVQSVNHITYLKIEFDLCFNCISVWT